MNQACPLTDFPIWKALKSDNWQLERSCSPLLHPNFCCYVFKFCQWRVKLCKALGTTPLIQIKAVSGSHIPPSTSLSLPCSVALRCAMNLQEWWITNLVLESSLMIFCLGEVLVITRKPTRTGPTAALALVGRYLRGLASRRTGPGEDLSIPSQHHACH